MDMITALKLAVSALQEEENRCIRDDDISNGMASRNAYLQINDLICNLKAVKKTEED